MFKALTLGGMSSLWQYGQGSRGAASSAKYHRLLTAATSGYAGDEAEQWHASLQRARKTLAEHLRAAVPPLSAARLRAEQTALDEAFIRLGGVIEANPEPLDTSPPPSAVDGGENDPARPRVFEPPDTAGKVLAAEPPAASSPQAAAESKLAETTPQAGNDNAKGASRAERLNSILREFQADSSGVEGSALISEDGLLIASSLSEEAEELRVAGMTATLHSLGTRAARELARGAVQEIVVRGDRGYAVVIGVGRDMLLLAIANDASRLGLILFDMREAARSLLKLL